MAETKKPPESYKDPYWSNLSTMMEKKYKLPSGLLVDIVQKGEKTNNSQVSPVGARTVYQITPTTRNLVVKKYGIDPYESPQKAAQTAALLLKESLDRNKGNVELAVREYHGGTNKDNWGKVNNSYVSRVLGVDGGSRRSEPKQGESFFSRAMQRQKSIEPSIAQVYDIYKKGGLSAQQAKDFEADVKSGAIMLPRGATLKGQKTSNPKAITLPQALSDKYANNELTPQQRSDLEADIKAGLVKLPVATKFKQTIPDFSPEGVAQPIPTEQAILAPPKPEPTLGERAIGVGETGLTALTGATSGAAGFIGGTARGVAGELLSGEFGTPEAARRIEQSAAQGAEALTYAPRTETGQQYTQALGEATAPFAALTPMGGELAMVTQSLKGVPTVAAGQAQRAAVAAAPAARQAAQTVARPIQAAGQAVQSGVNRVAESVGLRTPEGQQGANIGAAQVPPEVVREMIATDLPVPFERATAGQLTRDPMLLKEESEISKLPAGEAYRQLQEEQTAIANMNMEKFNEMTGSTETDLYRIGEVVDSAMKTEFAKDKAKTKAAYNAADKSDESKAVVDLTQPVKVNEQSTTLTGYLNGQVEGATETIVPTARKLAVHHGLAKTDENGQLVPLNPTIKQMENFRKDINAKVNDKESADIRQASIIKNFVDEHTAPYEGKMYQTARKLRQQQAKKWESNQIIKDIVGSKRGSDDRKIAYESVVDRVIKRGSVDDISKVRRVLMTSGDEGKQAWKEIQGATIRDIHERATAGVAPDAQGNKMISPAALDKAIKDLDKSGKLEKVFGYRGAEQLRTFNQVSKDLFTVPKSAAVNTSNTNSALTMALDMIAANMTTGLPIPVVTALKSVSRFVKDKKLKAQIDKSIVKLGQNQPKEGRF